MSMFSEAEIAYLQSNSMGRLATIGTDGRPHLVPLTYRFNADEDAIDIGGVDFPNTKKWRDICTIRTLHSWWTTLRPPAPMPLRFAATRSLTRVAVS
jgi:PPOX class F420-dependent enzyme/OxyR family protein